MLLQCRPIAELYPEIVQSYSMQIEQPMDLGTIGEKLDRGEYTVRAGHLAPGFVSDVQLVFLNCMTFNAPGVEVNGFEFHKHAKEMLELFEKESGCESPVFEEPGQATLGMLAGASTGAQPHGWSKLEPVQVCMIACTRCFSLGCVFTPLVRCCVAPARPLQWVV